MNSIAIACLLILAFIVGSIMVLRPTPMQRRQAQYRSSAIASGIQIGFSRDSADTYPKKQPLLVYSKRRINDDTPPPIDAGCFKRDSTNRQFDIKTATINRCLKQLPSSVNRVTFDAELWSVYWDESGSTNDLEAIIDTLNQLSKE